MTVATQPDQPDLFEQNAPHRKSARRAEHSSARSAAHAPATSAKPNLPREPHSVPEGELDSPNIAPALGEYVSVAVDAPLFRPYTYYVPGELLGQGPLSPGQRVLVPLGKSNLKTVGFLLGRVPTEVALANGRTIKSIQSVLDPRPLMTPSVYELARKIADYYCCPLGTALAAVVPAAVKNHAGEKRVRVVERVEPTPSALSRDLAAQAAAAPAAAELEAEPKLEPEPKLAAEPKLEPEPESPALPKLTIKQQSVLSKFDEMRQISEPVRVDELINAAGCTPGMIRRLAELGQLRVRDVRMWDLEFGSAAAAPPTQPTQPEARPSGLTLNAEQQAALDTVCQRLRPPSFGVVLVNGVTGSGKTEVYLRAIEQVVAAGRQAIVLVPEIALTPQTQDRFAERFGSVAVLHSHLSDTARHAEWRRIAAGRAAVVVGARSAIFAPCPRLGLIVVDEEHDSSYKQSDGQPRYHARDVAVLRGQLENCPVVLGSATPSLESLHNCRMKPHFVRVDLPNRVEELPLPPVSVVDMRAEHRRRPDRHILSGELEEALRDAFRRGEQAILLLNRRGHSTFLVCPRCGYVARCEHCDVSVVWHQTSQLGVCHYCREAQPPPHVCPGCSDGVMKRLGAGTQRLEEELTKIFPEVAMARMDSDTTSAAGAHDKILSAFRRGAVQLLMGTQMIAKGLHFPRVTVVGVVNADTSLAIPDFRASERTFQLISQVAGRAGRSQLGGRVIVQTYEPGLSPIQRAAAHDFPGFAEEELTQRAALAYPPYTRLVSLVIRDVSRERAEQSATAVLKGLREIVEARKLAVRFKTATAVPAPLAKLSDQYRYLLVAAAETPGPLQAMLAEARQGTLLTVADVAVDVDPVAIL